MPSTLTAHMMKAHTAELHRVAAEQRRAAEFARPSILSGLSASVRRVRFGRTRTAGSSARATRPTHTAPV